MDICGECGQPVPGSVQQWTNDQIVDYTARNEGGGSYTAWNPNDNGHGVSCGLIMFNAQQGTLPLLLERMFERDESTFKLLAPYDWERLKNRNFVTKEDLNSPRIKEAILKLLGEPLFQAVQRQIAEERYLIPSITRIFRYFEKTPGTKARCMAFDIEVQYGGGGLNSKLRQAASKTRTGRKSVQPASQEIFLFALAEVSDTHGYDNERRHRILEDPLIPW